MSLVVLKQDLLDVSEGIICQQVNCKNVYGKGISGAIAKSYPQVAEAYHASFAAKSSKDLFGSIDYIQVKDRLIVANLYTQFGYGNAYRNHQKYTDEDRLVDAITRVYDYGQSIGYYVYLPWKIGCGLGGGDWESIVNKINAYLGYSTIYVCARECDLEGVIIYGTDLSYYDREGRVWTDSL